jgi:hypothetical protein
LSCRTSARVVPQLPAPRTVIFIALIICQVRDF